ncbi:MAG: hypothetical protein ABR976_19205 [Terracidiphilus sp.]|jgi:hypothetical protein
MPIQQVLPWLTGLAGLAILWIVVFIATKRHPWALVIGEDGRPSTSKFQMMVWTAAVVFAFLALYEIRFSKDYCQEMPGVPTNLLIAMGISVATAVSAKSIAVSTQSKTDAANAVAAAAGLQIVTPPSQSGIFADDSGKPDLGKVQVVLWTAIAVGVFLSEVFALIHNPGAPYFDPKLGHTVWDLGLPDIGQTLMILMGLGNGAYIGKKIAES